MSWRTVVLGLCSGIATWIVADATHSFWLALAVGLCVTCAYMVGYEDMYAICAKRLDELVEKWG